MQEAVDIAQDILDVTGSALMAKDFARFADCFCLPLTMGTDTGTRVLRSTEEHRRVFDRAVAYYDALGMTRLERRVEAAVFDGPDVVRTSHVSQPFKGDTPLAPPYPNFAALKRGPDRWRVTHAHHMLRDFEGLAQTLLPQNPLTAPPDESAQASVRTMQALLDQGTEAVLTRDYAAFAACVHLPLFVQGPRASTVIDSDRALRAEFGRQLGEFALNEITDIVRRVKHVEAVGSDRLYGIFRTHVLRGTTLALPSYSSAMTLERASDGQWRTSMVTQSLQKDGPRPDRYKL